MSKVANTEDAQIELLLRSGEQGGAPLETQHQSFQI